MVSVPCSKKSVSDVYSQGKICVLDIDMQGVRAIKATDLAPLYVFIKPPSVEELVSELIIDITCWLWKYSMTFTSLLEVSSDCE